MRSTSYYWYVSLLHKPKSIFVFSIHFAYCKLLCEFFFSMLCNKKKLSMQCEGPFREGGLENIKQLLVLNLNLGKITMRLLGFICHWQRENPTFISGKDHLILALWHNFSAEGKSEKKHIESLFSQVPNAFITCVLFFFLSGLELARFELKSS